MTATEPGSVQFNAPPPGQIMASVNRIALDAAAGLPAGAKGAVFGIATEKGGNAVFVQRFDGEKIDWIVTAYIGKEWGQPKPNAGVAVVMTW